MPPRSILRSGQASKMLLSPIDSPSASLWTGSLVQYFHFNVQHHAFPSRATRPKCPTCARKICEINVTCKIHTANVAKQRHYMKLRLLGDKDGIKGWTKFYTMYSHRRPPTQRPQPKGIQQDFDLLQWTGPMLPAYKITWYLNTDTASILPINCLY